MIGQPLLQMSALLLLVSTSESSSSVSRLSQVEWQSYHEMDNQGPGTYAFGYDVEDPANGNTQFRQEERLPNGTVTGSYGVVEPDGNVRVVRYIADSMGYRVTIENVKKRYGRYSTAGGPEDNTIVSKDTHPRQLNSVPTNEVWRKQHVYEQNESQISKFYFPRYIYRKRRSLSSQQGVLTP